MKLRWDRIGGEFGGAHWRRWFGLCLWLIFLSIGCGAAAQDNAAQEAAHRTAVLSRLAGDAAQRVFGLETNPAPGRPEAIGAYERGCLEGAVELPADGPNWQVMRPSRDRAWGHPVLIGFIERLAAKLPAEAGWPGLLIGDIAQPRGGPMLTGHGSHQIGLDADIWLTPMPNRRLSPAAREEMSATDVVAADGENVDPAVWNPDYRRLYEAVAREKQVARIFVNPAIKRELVPRGRDRPRLADQNPAMVGPQKPFPYAAVMPARPKRMPRSGAAAARRWLRQAAGLVVHPRGAPSAAFPRQAIAGRRSAARLRRAGRGAQPGSAGKGAVIRPGASAAAPGYAGAGSAILGRRQ